MKLLPLFFATVLSYGLYAQNLHKNVEIAGTGITLGATLCTPVTPTKTCFLMIAGSGPTDRNCNSPSLTTDAFLQLADSLAAHGFASLRYDKRGIGQSTIAGMQEEDLRFDDMVDDARTCIKWIKTQGYTNVIVAGHSEGSLVGMIAAKDLAQGYISMCGVAVSADEILKDQLGKQISGAMFTQISAQLDSLADGQLVHNNMPNLQSIFRPSVQPYLISWMKYKPCAEVAKLQIPMLMIGGKLDIQVPANDAMKLNVCANNRKPALIIAQMTHTLKIVADESQQMESYTDPTMPLSAKLVQALVLFGQQFAAD